jgi:hypothetical protein
MKNIIVLAILVITMSPIAYGTVWNSTNDFSVDNGNPNGAWSYGWMDPDFTNFTLYESGNYSGPQGSPIWYTQDTSPAYGCVWRNTEKGVFGQLELVPGTVPMGWEWPVADARWTAPEGISGFCDIDVLYPDGFDTSVQVAVRIRGIPVWSAWGYRGAIYFQTIVAPGDTIDFVARCGPGVGPGFSRTTPVNATITVVPEPSTLLLLGPPFVVLLRRRRASVWRLQ